MLFGSSLAAFELGTLPEQIVNGLQMGAVYALIALGYTMVYGVLRLINFAHGEVFMLGAYAALFVSWAFGFKGDPTLQPTPHVWILIAMLLVSMTVCGLIGVAIERYAYRPLRTQPRITSLITAIGVSLLLQYAGQLVLPNSPAPNISQKVNPFQDNYNFTLRAPVEELRVKAADLKTSADEATRLFEAQKKKEADVYNLSVVGKELRETSFDLQQKANVAKQEAEASAIRVNISKGYIIIFVTTLVLMAILRHVVMFTKTGRAMRAVSQDYDSAALMGVNVDRIITITFIIGSALAGAGAMLSATFQPGIKVDTFFGLLPGVKAFVAAVLGGIGNIPGAVLGGFLLGLAEAIVVWGGGSAYTNAVAFIILIVVLLFMPGGLLGSAKVEKV
jgi:branched-chain amino acid transport system permease protein